MPTYSPMTIKKKLSPIEMYRAREAEMADMRRLERIDEFDPIIIDGVVTDYGISPKGDVFSFLTNKPLSKLTAKNGKQQVMIYYKKGNQRGKARMYVDRLVANAYMTNPDGYKYLLHLDGDLTNCCVENLQWTNYFVVTNTGISFEQLKSFFDEVRDRGTIDGCPDDKMVVRFKAAIEHMKQQNVPIEANSLISEMRNIVMDGGYIDDKFQISPYGIIRNILSGRYYLGYLNVDSYLTIRFHDTTYRTHRLVAQTYIPNQSNRTLVHHKDSNKLNPCMWNLEWVTPKENSEHGVELGEYLMGENSPKAKYTDAQIEKVCELIDRMEFSMSAISKMTGVDMTAIDSVRNARNWKHIAMKYRMPYCIFDRDGKYVTEDKQRTIVIQRRLAEYRAKTIENQSV